uniref:Dehydrogenase/reductase 2 n=1 Tax=Neovison vison TaxID=452646 RepID=A0A8C7BR84_NEOVI
KAVSLKHHGGLDFLVCNAAVNILVGCTLKASEEVWDKKLGVYNISKTAILGLTRTLSVELAPKGIRVNCLTTPTMGPSSRVSGCDCPGLTVALDSQV